MKGITVCFAFLFHRMLITRHVCCCLQELQYLNVALNNISKLQNLQRCESLQKLDVTLNFISKAGLLSMRTLQHNIHLQDLHCLGNPCSQWTGYRPYVIAVVPTLCTLVRSTPVPCPCHLTHAKLSSKVGRAMALCS